MIHLMDNERFWKKVNKTDTCWLWTGAISPQGYGQIGVRGYTTQAHRVSYEISHGSIPDGMFVCHKCDIRNCVNPEHLFVGTQSDNLKDASIKGRTAKGSRNGRSKLTEDQVSMILKLHSEGNSQGQIAKIFDVSRPAISLIISGKRWKRGSD